MCIARLAMSGIQKANSSTAGHLCAPATLEETQATEYCQSRRDEPRSLSLTWPPTRLASPRSVSTPRSCNAGSVGSTRLRPLSKGALTARGEGSVGRPFFSSSWRPGTVASKEEVRPRSTPHQGQLPASVVAKSAGRPKLDAVSAAYLWNPVRFKEHAQHSQISCTGTHVNTLSMDVASRSFEGASSHMMRLVPGNFTARESVWCYLVGGTFVVCKGIVVGTCPQHHDPASGKNMRIAQLPVKHRPAIPLQFAALSREAYDVGGQVAYNSQLVTLVVMPDGWIFGVSSRGAEGAMDLSAIRFSVDKGISLIDDVRLHTCDVAGSRLVALQGTLSRRHFRRNNNKPLAILPESCRPPCQMPFIVAGDSPGGFHLIIATPSHGFGTGGDLKWRDSIWDHDRVNLTGIMFEVAADALAHSTLSTKWTPQSKKIFVEDFQKCLIRRFGSIEHAWYQAFDTDGSGEINFTEFGLGCKVSGFVGNATRIWAALDDDGSGGISLDELGMDTNCFLERSMEGDVGLPAIA